MKTLVLIRHAKSSWDEPGLADFDRPLNHRGKRDAPAMGRLLSEQGIVPDAFVSSPAKRARKTAKLMADALGYPRERLRLVDSLYLSGIEAMLTVIHHLDDTDANVFLVSHNPDLTDLANTLAGMEIENIPTAAVAVIDFPIEHWRDVASGKGTCRIFVRPAKTEGSD